jgi:hypothetical protein
MRIRSYQINIIKSGPSMYICMDDIYMTPYFLLHIYQLTADQQESAWRQQVYWPTLYKYISGADDDLLLYDDADIYNSDCACHSPIQRSCAVS